MKERYKLYIKGKVNNKWFLHCEGNFYYCREMMKQVMSLHSEKGAKSLSYKIVQAGKIDIENNGGIVK